MTDTETACLSAVLKIVFQVKSRLLTWQMCNVSHIGCFVVVFVSFCPPSYRNVHELIDFHHVLAAFPGSLKDCKSASPQSELESAFKKSQESFQQVTACLSKESSCYRYRLSVSPRCGD